VERDAVVDNGALVGVEIGRDVGTHADLVVSCGGEAAVSGISLESDAEKQCGGIGVDSECADLQGNLESKVDEREDDIGCGELGESEAVPLDDRA
jgi:hypothetical protein